MTSPAKPWLSASRDEREAWIESYHGRVAVSEDLVRDLWRALDEARIMTMAMNAARVDLIAVMRERDRLKAELDKVNHSQGRQAHK